MKKNALKSPFKIEKIIGMNKRLSKKMILAAGCVFMLLSVAEAEDFIGKIAKIHVTPASTAGKTIVKISFKYPLDYRRTDLAQFSCIESGEHFVKFSDERIPLATLNHILSLALTAQSTGRTFAVDVSGSPNPNACENGEEAYILN